LNGKRVDCEDTEPVTGKVKKSVQDQKPVKNDDQNGKESASYKPISVTEGNDAVRGRSKSAPLRELPQNEKVNAQHQRKSTGGFRAQEEASGVHPDIDESLKKRKRAYGREAKAGAERDMRNGEKRSKSDNEKTAPHLEKSLPKGLLHSRIMFAAYLLSPNLILTFKSHICYFETWQLCTVFSRVCGKIKSYCS
jgi:hypothetical protein